MEQRQRARLTTPHTDTACWETHSGPSLAPSTAEVSPRRHHHLHRGAGSHLGYPPYAYRKSQDNGRQPAGDPGVYADAERHRADDFGHHSGGYGGGQQQYHDIDGDDQRGL